MSRDKYVFFINGETLYLHSSDPFKVFPLQDSRIGYLCVVCCISYSPVIAFADVERIPLIHPRGPAQRTLTGFNVIQSQQRVFTRPGPPLSQDQILSGVYLAV